MLNHLVVDLVLDNQLSESVGIASCCNQVLGFEGQTEGCAELVGLIAMGDVRQTPAGDVVAGIAVQIEWPG